MLPGAKRGAHHRAARPHADANQRPAGYAVFRRGLGPMEDRDYLHAHDVLLARRDRIEDELSKLAAEAPCTVAISRLRCRGVLGRDDPEIRGQLVGGSEPDGRRPVARAQSPGATRERVL